MKKNIRSPVLIIPATVFFTGGIVCKRLAVFPLTDTFALTLVAIFALLLLGGHFRKIPAAVLTLFLAPIFFLAGTLQNVDNSPPPDPDHIHNLISNGEEVVIVATVHNCPIWDGEKSRLTANIHSIRKPENVFYSAKGLAALSLPFEVSEQLSPGDLFLARTKLSLPNGYKNPGVANYQKFLADHGIHLTGWIKSPALITKIDQISPQPLRRKIYYFPEKIRQKIYRLIDTASLAQTETALYKALLIGIRNTVPPEILENYKASGAMHLLAISGLHVGMLALIICGFFIFLLKRSTWLVKRYMAARIAAPLTILPLIGYALIAGFQPPVIRALIMSLVLLAALMAQRTYSLAVSISLAALAILFLEPESLFYPSFQLSFAAVISIAALFPIIRERIYRNSPSTSLSTKTLRWILTALGLSCAALIGTLPLSLFYFNRFSLLSPVATLLVTPLLCLFSLPIGFLAAVLSAASPSLAKALLSAGSWGISGANHITHLIAQIPCSSIWLPTPTVIEILIYYSLIILLVLACRRKKTAYARASVLVLTILIALQLSPKIIKHLSKTTSVSFLDVGAGSSTLIEFPGERNILVDGGGYASKNFDVGSRVIAPCLWKKKISHLDAVIITHPHADHYNGLKFILERFAPDKLWINNRQMPADQTYVDLLRLAQDHNIEIGVPAPGEILFRRGGSQIKVLGEQHRDKSKTGRNRKSLVVQIKDAAASFLLPGDIFRTEEKELVEKGLDLKSDVLLAPHHGSKTSGSTEFLNEVSPSYLVVSTDGRSPKYPDGNLIEYCRKNNIRMLITGISGMVSFKTADPLKMTTCRP